MPGQQTATLEWPYLEGLRLDEAMHPLTLLASGLYGRELPASNGAPLRLVIPWKYGMKEIQFARFLVVLNCAVPVIGSDRGFVRSKGHRPDRRPGVIANRSGCIQSEQNVTSFCSSRGHPSPRSK